MKKIHLTSFLSLCIILSSHIFSQNNEGIVFTPGEWSEIIADAGKQNKYIFVDAYTDWCYPCKLMDKQVFSQKSAGDFYNSKFISYKLNMESDLGKEFETNYNVTAYPMYLFFDPEGKLVHKSGKYKSAEEFIEDGKNAIDPEKSIFNLGKRYLNGERGPELLYNYAIGLKNIEELAGTKVIEEYLKTQSNTELLNPKNWNFLKDIEWDINSYGFTYIINNVQKYIDTYGFDDVNKKISLAYTEQARIAALHKNPQSYLDGKDNLNSTVLKNKDELSLRMDIEYYKWSKDEVNLLNSIFQFMDKYSETDQSKLNEYANNVFKNTDDKLLLEKALDWSAKSIELENNYNNNDTYAWILFKLGRKEDALRSAESAITIGQQMNQNTSSSSTLIEKIKNNK